MPGAITLSVTWQAPWLLPLDRRALETALRAMLALCAAPGSPMQGVLPFSQLELVIVRDTHSAAANRRYLGCQGPTNILSFPPAAGTAASLLLNADAVRREAALYGQDTTAHCLRLVAHGLAHVLGCEHGPDMDALCQCLYLRALDSVV